MWRETCGSEGVREMCGSEGERECGGRRVGVRVRGGVRETCGSESERGCEGRERGRHVAVRGVRRGVKGDVWK